MNAGNPFIAWSARATRALQPGRHHSRVPTMCKAGHSLPSATDLPSPLVNHEHPVPPEIDGHLFVDIFTLCFVAVVVLLYLVLKIWQRKRAVAAAEAAEAAAAAAAALAVHTEETQTDDPLFTGLDDTINRLYQELSSHQHRLDSIEAYRLEMVNFNRLLSFLPKPNLPKEEEDFTHQDSADPYDGSWSENRIKYPAV